MLWYRAQYSNCRLVNIRLFSANQTVDIFHFSNKDRYKSIEKYSSVLSLH